MTRSRNYISGAMLAAAWLVTSAAGQPSITVLNCGAPTDLNSDGTQVVGFGSSGVYRWTQGASPRYGVIAGGAQGSVYCSSDASTLGGMIINTDGAGGQPNTLPISGRWMNGAWENCGVFDIEGGGNCSGSINTSNDISANGRYVVGGGWINGCASFRGFVWDGDNGSMVSLPNSSGLSNRATRGNSVSSDGSVVAGYDSNGTTGVRMPAVWVRNSGSGAYELTVLHTDGGEAYEINDQGTTIVGYNFTLGSNHVVMWNADGAGGWNSSDLGTLTTIPAWVPADYTVQSMTATGVSNDGSVVVGIVTYALFSSRVRGGFIWTAGDGMQDWYTYLALENTPGLVAIGGDGTSVPGLGVPGGISADGTTVIGGAGAFTAPGPTWAINLLGGSCSAPEICSHPVGTAHNRCGFSGVILNVGYSGGAEGLTYQWRLNGQLLADGVTPHGSTIVGAATSQLRVNTPRPQDAGNYDCVITNVCGTATSNVAEVTVAAAAANDTCATATPVQAVATPGNTYAFDLCTAYTDEGAASCVTSSLADVWYSLTPDFSGTVAIGTCGLTAVDTVISLHDGCNATELVCSDNACGNQSLVTDYHVDAGHTYLVRVARKGTSATGTLTGSLNVTQLTVDCLGDFDGDGFVTGLDFDAYVTAFEAGELSSDFDGDGFITGLDFDAYVAAFEAGC